MDKNQQQNFLNISDYALIHKTKRKKNCGTRVSIDTTFYVGKNFEVTSDRKNEYLNEIPNIGRNLFAKCHSSINDNFNLKKSSFSHYSKGSVSYIDK